jgi:translation elongation factor EF-Tu-like GTPase
MRAFASSLFAVLLATGCSGEAGAGPGPAPAGSRGPAEVPRAHAYAAGEPITADLTMLPTGDGGRRTPFRSGYRPGVVFESEGREVACAVLLPDGLDAFPPGETHTVVFECADAVAVEATGFTLVEHGRERGRGDVVLTGG